MDKTLRFRLARENDDKQIRELLDRTYMPGPISLSFSFDPALFRAIDAIGREHRMIVAEKGRRIVGIGVAGKHRVYLDGVSREIGYLSRLRLDIDTRNSLALARGYKYFKHLHETSLDVPFYFSSILENNKYARSVLTSGRGGLPEYRELDRYRTAIIPVFFKKRVSNHTEMHVMNGTEIGEEKLIAFVNEYGRRKNFFPAYDPGNLFGKASFLKGLRLKDFLVAGDKSNLLGTLALWDPAPFEQIVVRRYSWWLRYLRNPVNSFLRIFFKSPPLPEIGEPLKIAIAACIVVKDNSPKILQCLLKHALVNLHKKKVDYLAVGLAETDSLISALTPFIHFCIHSRIYKVAWEQDPKWNKVLNGGINYFEAGSL